MSTANRLASNLPRLFNKNIFEMIDLLMNNPPIFQLPHSRDFMDFNDNIYIPKFVCHESEATLHDHDSLM